MSDPTEELIVAAVNGDSTKVERLMEDERVDPTASDNYAIRISAEKGHDQVVKLLLNDRRVDPAAKDNEAIRSSADNGHDKVVNVLIASFFINKVLNF